MSDLDWYVCEIEPDRHEEERVLRNIAERVYIGKENILLAQCMRERWNRVLNRLLHIETGFVSDPTYSHLRILDRFWVALTCPFHVELITTIILDYNFSLAGVTYQVTVNDTFRRLRSLHNAGVNIKGLRSVSETSVFFIVTLLDAGLFPTSGVLDRDLLFENPRSLLDTSKVVVRSHLGHCQRQVLKARIGRLEIPITVADYLFEKF